MEEALNWDASSDFNKMCDLNPGSLMLELEKHNIWCYTGLRLGYFTLIHIWTLFCKEEQCTLLNQTLKNMTHYHFVVPKELKKHSPQNQIRFENTGCIQ